MEGFQTLDCRGVLDFTYPQYFDAFYGYTRVIWGCIAPRRLPVQVESDKAKGFITEG
jgi:hypothetical protein